VVSSASVNTDSWQAVDIVIINYFHEVWVVPGLSLIHWHFSCILILHIFFKTVRVEVK
jgi:hypothetical protein